MCEPKAGYDRAGDSAVGSDVLLGSVVSTYLRGAGGAIHWNEVARQSEVG